MLSLVSWTCCCAHSAEAEHVHIVDTSSATSGESHLAGSLQKSAEPNFRSRPHDPATSNKEIEKVRLQEIVREFSKEAMTGVKVKRIDANSLEISESFLVMDKYLYTLTFRPLGDSDRRFNMKDLNSIYKGPDFTQKVPKLAHLSPHCVGLEFTGSEDYKVLFYFQDVAERDQFYTCLKILRMSVDINSARIAAKGGGGG
mmetsp:Transcript_34397/g.87528  ORF Transcript_34397/g.87528 Transcript_34397/m.87528 type:complete len:200 (-) Transcript_34397:52-651(-)